MEFHCKTLMKARIGTVHTGPKDEKREKYIQKSSATSPLGHHHQEKPNTLLESQFNMLNAHAPAR
jgi:hypothetical protein